VSDLLVLDLMRAVDRTLEAAVLRLSQPPGRKFAANGRPFRNRAPNQTPMPHTTCLTIVKNVTASTLI
jgi:hypothetical protein